MLIARAVVRIMDVVGLYQRVLSKYSDDQRINRKEVCGWTWVQQQRRL
jgi:hypothetical protein